MEELALLHRQISGRFSRLAAILAISAGGRVDNHSHALHGLPPCPGLLMNLPLGAPSVPQSFAFDRPFSVMICLFIDKQTIGQGSSAKFSFSGCSSAYMQNNIHRRKEWRPTSPTATALLPSTRASISWNCSPASTVA
ncbi:hypothetical protein ELH02_27090 (plasmid) [Rhizobium ruizarguesonis]|nr:hypothetical protein ELH19_30780 [Rhizobium ruizarguesonis]TCB02801.1 hypothetical protein E0H65_03415 [Rhizobium leguminosarum bv. viciae]TBD32903.1 hypothetical protein ELH18_26405 [Rhizobium ruizarguesonis]TBD52138.1 hypothetical protein ELH15_32690 [Rhizobium ruizarguesonis]TBD75543.1 hypothetical protein ELH14_31835 [Rhizobium ruizarguesonis]